MSEATERQSFLLQMRVNDEWLRRLDDWRRLQPSIPSRAEVIRMAIRALSQPDPLDEIERQIEVLKQNVETLQKMRADHG